MARDSSGTKNQPQYAGTGAPADAADLSELGNFAAFVGNRKVGPATGTATGPGNANTGRTTSSGSDVWEGLEWHDTTDGGTYKYISGNWVLREMPSTAWTPTVANVGTSAISAFYAVQAGVVKAFFKITVSGAPTNPPTVTLPVAIKSGAPSVIGRGVMIHTSTSARVDSVAFFLSSTSVQLFPTFTSGSPAYTQYGITVGSGNPFTWSSGDTLEFTLDYLTS